MQLRSFVGCGESEELKCAADEQKEGDCLFLVGVYSLILKGKDGELNDVLAKLYIWFALLLVERRLNVTFA